MLHLIGAIIGFIIALYIALWIMDIGLAALGAVGDAITWVLAKVCPPEEPKP
jgi:hypothetical protein